MHVMSSLVNNNTLPSTGQSWRSRAAHDNRSSSRLSFCAHVPESSIGLSGNTHTHTHRVRSSHNVVASRMNLPWGYNVLWLLLLDTYYHIHTIHTTYYILSVVVVEFNDVFCLHSSMKAMGRPNALLDAHYQCPVTLAQVG